MPFGATPRDWDHLTLVLGLQEHLLPVVSNPSALISENSSIKRLGQIPSIYNHLGKVAGFAKWTDRFSTGEDIECWRLQDDYGICIQTRAIRALDCDITNEDLAAQVYAWLQDNLPTPLPLRGRSNASKFLLAFRLEDKKYAKRVLHLPNGNAGDKIEFLADGQQFIAVGTHPSGVPYAWRGGLPDAIPTLSEAQFDLIWQSLKTHFSATEAKENLIDRKPPGGAIDDDKLSFLEKVGVVLGYSPEGAAYVSCPFKSGHSKEGDRTETIYFPAGLRDYEVGHFKCLHASCSGRSDQDFLDALNYTQSLFDVVTLEDVETLATSKNKYAFVDIANFSNRAPPEYIIKNVMPRADLIVLFGESGSGKSFLALDQAFSVARGVDWNGHKTKQGRVAYVVAEGAGGFRNRALAYARHYDLDLSTIPLSVLADQPNLLDTQDSAALGRAIKDLGEVSIVFIDTFAQTTPGANENSAEDIGKALSHCRSIKKMTGATVVLIHHAGKDLTKGARGWSGLRAAADAEIEVSRNENKRNIRISKQKDGEDGAEWGLMLIDVPVGLDEDGSVISSCVVEYTQKQTLKPKEKRFGPLERLVLDIFEKDGQQSIAIDLLSDEVKKLIPVPEGKDNRGFRIRRVIEALAAKGEVGVRDNMVSREALSEWADAKG